MISFFAFLGTQIWPMNKIRFDMSLSNDRFPHEPLMDWAGWVFGNRLGSFLASRALYTAWAPRATMALSKWVRHGAATLAVQARISSDFGAC